MLGRIRWGNGRKIELYTERLCGLSVLTAKLPENSRRPERAVGKAARLLRKNRVVRVLTPPEFLWWEILWDAGLCPVDTAGLRRTLAPVWVAAQLKRQGVSPQQAVLRLSGEERETALEGLARALCPLVYGLVFDLPGGEAAAERLRREMGIPVFPTDYAKVHLTLPLRNGPVLTGVEAALPGRVLPDDCDRFPLLSVLWESGSVKTEEIVLKL